MSTYVLIHGGGGDASSWDLVAKDLRDRGNDVVAVNLPIEDQSAGWSAYADAVVEATSERSDVVVVAHSLGGFTAPLGLRAHADRPARPRGGDGPHSW